MLEYILYSCMYKFNLLFWQKKFWNVPFNGVRPWSMFVKKIIQVTYLIPWVTQFLFISIMCMFAKFYGKTKNFLVENYLATT